MALTINGTDGIETNTDTGKLKFGTGDDLQIHHDGTQSVIETNSSATKPLHLKGDPIWFYKAGTSELFCKMVADSSVELYHDGTKKFETWSEGCKGRGIAHAYGVLDGQGTAHLDNDFGCGAITDVETGVFEIALTNALADNEAIVGCVNGQPINTSSQIFGISEIVAISTTAFRLSLRRIDNDAASMAIGDWDNVNFIIFDVA